MSVVLHSEGCFKQLQQSLKVMMIVPCDVEIEKLVKLYELGHEMNIQLISVSRLTSLRRPIHTSSPSTIIRVFFFNI